jgi:hypothetical protein
MDGGKSRRENRRRDMDHQIIRELELLIRGKGISVFWVSREER